MVLRISSVKAGSKGGVAWSLIYEKNRKIRVAMLKGNTNTISGQSCLNQIIQLKLGRMSLMDKNLINLDYN